MEPAEAHGTFWDHILSLRSHVLWGAVFFVVVSSLVFTYASSQIISLLLKPLQGVPLVFLSPLGPFLFKIQISLYTGFILSMPFWFYLVLHFIFPALTAKQKVVSSVFVLLSLLVGVLSLLGTYFYVVPTTLNFLLALVVPGTEFLLTTDSYLSFFLLQMMVTFIVLQLPFPIIISSYVGLLNPYTLAKKRQFLYPSLILLLAVLTPTTDAITLSIVTIPAVVLVEIGLAIAKKIYNYRVTE